MRVHSKCAIWLALCITNPRNVEKVNTQVKDSGPIGKSEIKFAGRARDFLSDSIKILEILRKWNIPALLGKF